MNKMSKNIMLLETLVLAPWMIWHGVRMSWPTWARGLMITSGLVMAGYGLRDLSMPSQLDTI